MTQQNEPTAEERALYLGERLFEVIPHKDDSGFLVSRESQGNISQYLEEITYANGNLDFYRYLEWLSSPDGLAAVELAIIEREYQVVYQGKREDSHFYNIYAGNNIWYDAEATTKAEAVLAAAYKALKSEEDKQCN